ncbi:MAG: S-layer homology domain-containing protein [Acidimicrobiia bacterium]|nr:S-layer homology domain-containing protein [Acidimicrobiia bacterium]
MKIRGWSRSVLLVAFALAVVAATPLGGVALDPGGTFSDDNGSVHEGSIEAIADVGITRGCNPPVNDMFCPDQAVTRAQMATFLVRALDLPAAVGSFVDTAGSVHEANIGALAAAGITVGCNPPVNDMFCPDQAVTRAQMATFLTRALNLDASPRVVVTSAKDLAGVAAGTAEAAAVAELTTLFGPPTADEAGRCPYFLPSENMRYVRWGSLIAAIKTVDSGDGQIGLVGWRYKLDGSGAAEPGGPLAGHVEMPFGLELLDPIGDAVTAGGGAIETTPFGWTIVEFPDFTVEATGLTIDPLAPIDGVQQGFGFSCE